MEGPSLLILREELTPFLGQKVLAISGNTKQPKETLKGCTLGAIDTWGKVLFLTFVSPQRSLRPIVTKTHFLMFGSYRLNDPRPERTPRLKITFRKGIIYFYSCSLRFGADAALNAIDRQVDIMSDQWNVDHVVSQMRLKKNTFLCDLFLDQSVFAGSGNIIKNEVLFNIRRHPLEKLSHISTKDWPRLARAVWSYGWNFYEWKKIFQLRRHWQVYRQSRCPLCDTKLIRESLGKFLRRTFYCPHHQVLGSGPTKLKVFPVLPMRHPPKPEPRLDH